MPAVDVDYLIDELLHAAPVPSGSPSASASLRGAGGSRAVALAAAAAAAAAGVVDSTAEALPRARLLAHGEAAGKRLAVRLLAHALPDAAALHADMDFRVYTGTRMRLRDADAVRGGGGGGALWHIRLGQASITVRFTVHRVLSPPTIAGSGIPPPPAIFAALRRSDGAF